MIEKALGAVFKVVTDEAARSPDFSQRLEDALAKFAEGLVEARRIERRIGDFHPLVEFRKATPEDFRARAARFDAAELRAIIARHNLDPAASLKSKTTKKALLDHMVAAAQKRAERDAKLFEY